MSEHESHLAPPGLSAEELQRPSERGNTQRGSVLVLIAEDEEPIAEALAIMVEEAGYEAQLARHGREALDMARQSPPSLVITDLMMPYLDGVALITAIREEAASKGNPAPPIILMTAAVGKRAEEAQPDDLLSKPFDLDEIENLLHHFLDHHADRTEEE